jgi:maltose alpha-D-glucosyltransferase/alpha-amylase
MRVDYTSDLWWKNAVIYCLDVEIFRDSDGDGVGDFRGLIGEIDYLAALGVTCVWLMPFYPSPNRDDGYDICDFYGVDSRLGTLGDLVEFVRTAADRGIRVIADLVVNHTSDKHPWFVEARASRDSPRRNWYVWRDKPAPEPAGLAFPDKERSNWQLDRRTGQYYLHRFYRFMPDLNISEPAVRDEICRITAFWLALGADGFRIDAVPFMCELDGISHPVDGDAKGWLRSLRAFVGRRDGESLLLGEVNTSLKELSSYFGDEDGDALHMEFAFMMNQSVWLALARESAEPIEQVISTLPQVPHDNAWATFLRNHDELSLDKLTVTQREEVFARFAPKPDMQMYGHGIRRRAASMLGGDGPRLRLAWSLTFSLPGTPVLFMGDEIGMSEQLEIPDRYAVRVPMQWSSGPSGGFSDAPPEELVRPQPRGAFGPAKVNVTDQRRDPDSLLRFVQRLIRHRRQTPEFGWGASTLIETEHPAVFAHRCDWEGSTVVAVHNLGGATAPIELPLGADAAGVHDLLADAEQRVPRGGTLKLDLEGYGGRWLRVVR